MRTIGYFFGASLIAAAAGVAGPVAAQTATLTTLHFFAGAGATPPDGGSPEAGLIADSTGALYGTTAGGGAHGAGTVFKLTPPATAGGPWSESVLYDFCSLPGCSDGSFLTASGVTAGLVFGADGALYGATSDGGAHGAGTVFKLTPPETAGGAWSESVLYSFCSLPDCGDGGSPWAGLIFDGSGALYGTTVGGGYTDSSGNSYGTVFKLTPPATAGGAWSESVLHTFTGFSDGAFPYASLIMDTSGALYGTTTFGGSRNAEGNVFKLTPPATAGGAWSESVLHEFCPSSCEDGSAPYGGLVMDTSGALYGVTTFGGSTGEWGTVFKLTPPATAVGAWSESVLYSFTGGSDGGNPSGTLIIDTSGALYGTTVGGGAPQDGTVFKLTPAAAIPWSESVLWSFAGSDGANPGAGVISDASGALFGTTGEGGLADNGTAFKLVTAASFSGSRGKANCIGKSVSPLAQKYGGLSAAAAALGYPNVQALQNAIAAYCGK